MGKSSRKICFWNTTKHLKMFPGTIFGKQPNTWNIFFSEFFFHLIKFYGQNIFSGETIPALVGAKNRPLNLKKLCVQVSISLIFLICVCLNILAITLFSLILTKFPLNVSLKVAFKFQTTLAWYFYFFEDDYKFKSFFQLL